MAKTSSVEMAESFKEIASATVYDVLDEMGYPHQTLDLGIKPLTKDMRIAGPAFTIQGCRSSERKDEKANFESFKRIYKAIYDGCVVVVNPERGSEGIGVFGELTSWCLKQRGAKGIVIDGGIRDRIGLLKIPDWPVFVRHTSHIESNGRYMNRDLQVPIVVTGQLKGQVGVRPGDLIVGDCDGILVIPKEILEDVLIKSKKVWEAECKTRRELAKGVPFEEVYERYGRA